MSKRNAMAALTRWVLAHKKIVVGVWVALALAGIAAAGPAGRSFEEQFNIPGEEAFAANSRIVERYDRRGRRFFRIRKRKSLDMIFDDGAHRARRAA